MQRPLRYWDVNVNGNCCLHEAMDAHGYQTLVFSSSATLCGYPDTVPITETAPIATIAPINPCGQTRAPVEHILADLQSSAADSWRISCQRYFNPIGAHPISHIGEDPVASPTTFSLL